MRPYSVSCKDCGADGCRGVMPRRYTPPTMVQAVRSHPTTRTIAIARYFSRIEAKAITYLMRYSPDLQRSLPHHSRLQRNRVVSGWAVCPIARKSPPPSRAPALRFFVHPRGDPRGSRHNTREDFSWPSNSAKRRAARIVPLLKRRVASSSPSPSTRIRTRQGSRRDLTASPKGSVPANSPPPPARRLRLRSVTRSRLRSCGKFSPDKFARSHPCGALVRKLPRTSRRE